MRFSTSLLAAGLSASVFAAPIPEDVYDECDDDHFPSSSAAVLSSSITSPSSVVAVPASSTSSVSSSFSSPAFTSSAAAVYTSVAASSASSSIVVVSTTAAASSSAPTVPAVSTSVETSPTSAAAAPTGTASTNGTFQWFGVNESGAEFGTAIPGVLGTDYTWPSTTSIGTLMGKGMNIFRIPFLMERMAPSVMTATLDATYLAALKTVVSYITAAGGHAVVEPHNYARYSGSVITSTADFKTFWTNVATEFATNDKVIFDCNNEPHDMPTVTLTAELMQACIDGVRAAGATSQYIFVEGTSYTGAWTWTTSGNSDNMGGLTDPQDKIIYEMHQYLDSDGSGTSSSCVSTTIGAERIADATAWLKANGKKGIIGEYAGGANAECETAVEGMLDALAAASDVWMGAMWWGGGPWWGEYMFAMEPTTSVGYVAYESILTKYVAA